MFLCRTVSRGYPVFVRTDESGNWLNVAMDAHASWRALCRKPPFVLPHHASGTIATAQAEDCSHGFRRRRLECTDEGQKHLIEVATTKQDVSTVLYGSKPLESEKCKGTTVLKGMDELSALIPGLIAAAEAGEFDAMTIAAG